MAVEGGFSRGGFEEKSSRGLGGKEKKVQRKAQRRETTFKRHSRERKGVLEQRAFSIFILRARDREKKREFIVGFSGFGKKKR